jgi:ornithine cyclodeaminase/alanine dehydrogenase-like protein (mu-crystallin family)
MRLLTADDVRAALPMSEAIEAMREAFTAVALGRAHMPLRTHLRLPGSNAATLTMPAATSGSVRLGTKLLTLFPDNRFRGLPFIQGMVVMFDADTGSPTGLLEGTALTAIRTGAASGLATQMLANPGASRVGIIGSGVQARTQLLAVCCVRTVERVAVYSPDDEHAQQFARDAEAHPALPDTVHVASSAVEVAESSDIICTATSSATPVLEEKDVSPGTHINAVGSFTPSMLELAPALLAGARLFVDHVPTAMEEAGEVIAAVRKGFVRQEDLVELGGILDGKLQGRIDQEDITVFKSVGLAVQDLCAAAVALRRADELGLGTSVDF